MPTIDIVLGVVVVVLSVWYARRSWTASKEQSSSVDGYVRAMDVLADMTEATSSFTETDLSQSDEGFEPGRHARPRGQLRPAVVPVERRTRDGSSTSSAVSVSTGRRSPRVAPAHSARGEKSSPTGRRTFVDASLEGSSDVDDRTPVVGETGDSAQRGALDRAESAPSVLDLRTSTPATARLANPIRAFPQVPDIVIDATEDYQDRWGVKNEVFEVQDGGLPARSLPVPNGGLNLQGTSDGETPILVSTLGATSEMPTIDEADCGDAEQPRGLKTRYSISASERWRVVKESGSSWLNSMVGKTSPRRIEAGTDSVGVLPDPEANSPKSDGPKSDGPQSDGPEEKDKQDSDDSGFDTQEQEAMSSGRPYASGRGDFPLAAGLGAAAGIGIVVIGVSLGVSSGGWVASSSAPKQRTSPGIVQKTLRPGSLTASSVTGGSAQFLVPFAHFQLQVSCTAACWIEERPSLTGPIIWEGVVSSGGVKLGPPAVSQIWLRVGDAYNVHIKINGVPVSFTGGGSGPFNYAFNSSGNG